MAKKRAKIENSWIPFKNLTKRQTLVGVFCSFVNCTRRIPLSVSFKNFMKKIQRYFSKGRRRRGRTKNKGKSGSVRELCSDS